MAKNDKFLRNNFIFQIFQTNSIKYQNLKDDNQIFLTFRLPRSGLE